MGAETPKQFLPLGGVPLLLHSLWAFDQAPSVDAVILVVPAKQERRVLIDIVERYGVKKVQKVVAGGETRQQSVHNGLKGSRPDAGNLAIHQPVPPVVTGD